MAKSKHLLSKDAWYREARGLFGDPDMIRVDEHPPLWVPFPGVRVYGVYDCHSYDRLLHVVEAEVKVKGKRQTARCLMGTASPWHLFLRDIVRWLWTIGDELRFQRLKDGDVRVLEPGLAIVLMPVWSQAGSNWSGYSRDRIALQRWARRAHQGVKVRRWISHYPQYLPGHTGRIVLEPPIRRIDGSGRPHAEGRPAIEWSPDMQRGIPYHRRLTNRSLVPGWQSNRPGLDRWAWHGTTVSPEIVRTPVERIGDDLTLNGRGVANVEERRVLLERKYGSFAEYAKAKGIKPVHEDKYGKLYRISEPVQASFVAVTCPSTGREYTLQVPRHALANTWSTYEINTAHEAVAWTFGKRASTYNPIAEA